MELVSLGLEALQHVAEHIASYRVGQSLLRHCDRALWVVEKCARWAVPPPSCVNPHIEPKTENQALDQDERPPPELVRPLPWVFFLMMLLTLRVARESISLANLIMGKPPLRSADVVVFIQSRRRYLRTLKYQGSRMMRARTSTQPQRPWYSGLLSLFQLTMCFQRQSHNYGNNNTTRVTNNDEVVVIKRAKKGRSENPTVTSGESTMERLIEKMMVDLDAESDEDSAITLTDAASPKTDRSECTESDQDTICETSTPVRSHDTDISQTNGDDIHFSPNKNQHSSSTPEKQQNTENHIDNDTGNQTFQISYIDAEADKTVTETSSKTEEKRKLEENVTESEFTNEYNKNKEEANYNSVENEKIIQDSALPAVKETLSPTQESENFINNEAAQYSRKTPKKDHKIANGRAVKSVPNKRKGANHHHRRGSNEALPQKVLPSHSSF